MASTRNKSLKCVACNTIISNKLVKLVCKGSCGLYYHSECLVLSTDDSRNLDKYGKLESWKCVRCRVASSSRVSTHLTHSTDNLTGAESDYVRQCFQHIKILTDQIFELSRNQSEMRKQLSDIQEENFKLKASLSSNVDSISSTILTRDVNSSYAAKVKLSNKSHTIEDKQMKLDASSNSCYTGSSASSQTKQTVQQQHNLTRSNVTIAKNNKRPSKTRIETLSSAIVVEEDNCIGDEVFQEVKHKRKKNSVGLKEKKLEEIRPKTKRKSHVKFLTGSSSKDHQLQ